MKLKNIIKTLRKAKECREGGELEKIDFKIFSIAIDEVIIKLKEQSELINSINQTNQDLLNKLKEEDEILNSTVWELQFRNMQTDYYKSIVEEVEVLLKKWVKDILIKKVIENLKTRRILDTSIHFDLKYWIDNNN